MFPGDKKNFQENEALLGETVERAKRENKETKLLNEIL